MILEFKLDDLKIWEYFRSSKYKLDVLIIFVQVLSLGDLIRKLGD